MQTSIFAQMATTGPSKQSGIARRRAAAKAEGSQHYMARRAEIVRAAAAVFRAKGVAATSIDDVARAAGADRATLYYYVGSKDELFQEVVLSAVVGNIELAERIAAGDETAAAKLEAVIAGIMASYAEFYPHLYVFLRETPETLAGLDHPELDMAALQRRFDHALTSIIREGVEDGTFRSDVPPRLAAYAIIGMLNWTHRWFQPNGPLDSQDVAKAFAALSVDGVTHR